MDERLKVVMNMVESLLNMNNDWTVHRVDIQAITNDCDDEIICWFAYIYVENGGVFKVCSNGQFYPDRRN